MTRPRGRPPLDPDDPSVSLQFKLPGKEYDAVYKAASAHRVSIAEFMRNVVRRELHRPPRDPRQDVLREK